MCSDFSHFQLRVPAFSTQISHIFNSDFPHFQLRFPTFSTRICNCRPLLSLIVKLVPNCEFIFTFEYFSNIQIQVSYPLFAYITRYTPKHFPIFVIVHVVEQQDNWNLSYHLNCPNSLYELSTNLFYVGIFRLLQKLQIHQTN